MTWTSGPGAHVSCPGQADSGKRSEITLTFYPSLGGIRIIGWDWQKCIPARVEPRRLCKRSTEPWRSTAAARTFMWHEDSPCVLLIAAMRQVRNLGAH